MKARKSRFNQKTRSNDLAAHLFLRIAEILLRGGIDSPNAERVLRQAFVQAALDKVRAIGLKPTQSNVASVAGVSRVEVRSILRGKTSRSPHQSTRVERIVAGWQTDALFLNSQGQPKNLVIKARKGSFEHLAKKYGRDVTSRTLLDQVVRHGLAVIDGNRVKLLRTEPTLDVETAAAQSDLGFLVSQLANLGSHKGKRTYVVRQAVVAARDLKSASVAKRIAVERLETVLSSMNEISTDRSPATEPKNRRLHRLLISAVVAMESEEKQT